MAEAKAKGSLTAPFTVLIDQREKLPYSFEGLHADAKQGNRPLIVPARTVHLATGDYTIEGYESRIAIERKGGQGGLADLFSTLGQERDRFVRELERLAQMEWAAVVVEASWADVLHGAPFSQLNPKTVFRSIIAWQQRYRRVHWAMAGDRQLAEVMTFRMLERWWKDHQQEREEMIAL